MVVAKRRGVAPVPEEHRQGGESGQASKRREGSRSPPGTAPVLVAAGTGAAASIRFGELGGRCHNPGLRSVRRSGLWCGRASGSRDRNLNFGGTDGKLLQTAPGPDPTPARSTRSSMFDGRWRAAVDRSTGPVGEALHRRGITADVLTATGLVSATVTALLVASGHLHLAVLFLIVTGLHDLLRRSRGQGGRHGVGPRRVLRLGDRPRRRRGAHGWRRLVPGRSPRGRIWPSCPWPFWV